MLLSLVNQYSEAQEYTFKYELPIKTFIGKFQWEMPELIGK